MEARSEAATLSPALRLRLQFAYDGSGRQNPQTSEDVE